MDVTVMQKGLDGFFTQIGFNFKVAYYYFLLGLDYTHEYTDQEIHRAHKLSLLCRHPDKTVLPVDTEQFSDLKDAERFIKDVKHMKMIDRCHSDENVYRDKYRALVARDLFHRE